MTKTFGPCDLNGEAILTRYTIVVLLLGSFSALLVGCAADETNLANPKVTDVEKRLEITSSAIPMDGECPDEFTIHGEGISPPIEWKGAPPETKSFAISLWRLSRKGGGEPPVMNSYWVLYNIPADVHSLPKDVKEVGVVGSSDKSEKYLPPQSKEQITEHYYLTVFALSKELEFEKPKVIRRDLIDAIKGNTLAEGTLKFHFKHTHGSKK